MQPLPKRGVLLLVIGAAGALAACSSKPRYFKPVSAGQPAEANLERDIYLCDQLARKGYKSGFKDAALKVGGGTAAGIGVGAGVAALTTLGGASSGLGTAISSSFAPAANAAAAATIVLPVAMFGISRAIRSGREKKHKLAMGQCLSELGYSPEGWVKAMRPKKGTTFAAPAPPQSPAPASEVVSLPDSDVPLP